MRLIGVDVGTTACKAVAIDDKGRVLASASAPYELHTPKPGWTEQNPDDWVHAAQQCLGEIGTGDAMAVTGQMHGSVFLDTDFKVIRPALLWNDARTATEVSQIEDTLGTGTILKETLNPPLTGFTLPKVLWLQNNEPDNYSKLSNVVLPKDYVRARLTNTLEPMTDVTDASGTGVFDVTNRKWSSALIEQLGCQVFNYGTVESATFCSPTVVAGCGDQAAGAIATGAVTPDVVSISLGTSGVVFAAQDAPEHDRHGRLHTFCHANGKWHSMGVILSCGGALRWVKDTFGFESFDEMARLAQLSKPTLATFKPYLAGERTPHNDPSLTASFQGLTLSDGKPEIARAAFHGVTDALRIAFDLICEIKGSRPSVRVTGGGATSDYWMQLLADSVSATSVRLKVDEGPAYGAAILAGVGLGCWPSVEAACVATVNLGRQFEPQPVY